MEYFCLHLGDGFVQDGFLQLALPYDDDEPTFSFQLAPDFLISLLIAGDFSHPEVGVCFWDMARFAIVMTVPKASVNENDGAVLGQDDIWGTGKSLDVHSVAEPQIP